MRVWPQVLRELMDCFEGADDSGSGWVALDGFEASLTRLREGCKSDDDFVSLIAACFQVPLRRQWALRQVLKAFSLEAFQSRFCCARSARFAQSHGNAHRVHAGERNPT